MAKVGVLALQGDFEAHQRAFAEAGAQTLQVRSAAELHSLDGLVLPGGESTTMLKLLRAEGFEVITPVNPLAGPATDAAAVREALDAVDGDVILVAHSYGGIPVTNAATDNPDVRALVYIAAYVPDEGETFGQIQEQVPGQLTPDRLVIGPYTTADGRQSVGASIDPAVFTDVFAADLPAEQSAAGSRPAKCSRLAARIESSRPGASTRSSAR